MNVETLQRIVRRRMVGSRKEADDLIVMIDVVATARAAAWGRAPAALADWIFGGAVLCEFFRPLKPEAYSDAAIQLRMRYFGIAKDPEMQRAFESALTPELLGAASVTEAIGLGLDALFSSESGSSTVERATAEGSGFGTGDQHVRRRKRTRGQESQE